MDPILLAALLSFFSLVAAWLALPQPAPPAREERQLVRLEQGRSAEA